MSPALRSKTRQNKGFVWSSSIRGFLEAIGVHSRRSILGVQFSASPCQWYTPCPVSLTAGARVYLFIFSKFSLIFFLTTVQPS